MKKILIKMDGRSFKILVSGNIGEKYGQMFGKYTKYNGENPSLSISTDRVKKEITVTTTDVDIDIDAINNEMKTVTAEDITEN